MAFLRWLLVIGFGLAAVVFGGALMLPPGFTVVRSIEIAAPPERVWPLLEDPRAWARWTVWNRRDPAMAMHYEGPASGAGAAWSWTSRSEGDGRMRFTAADRGRRLAYDLHFPDWDSTSSGDLTLEATPAGTRVRWTLHGSMGRALAARWFGLLGDRLIGPDFEAGLAQLKAEAEKP